jgi:hypothetical protein
MPEEEFPNIQVQQQGNYFCHSSYTAAKTKDPSRFIAGLKRDFNIVLD